MDNANRSLYHCELFLTLGALHLSYQRIFYCESFHLRHSPEPSRATVRDLTRDGLNFESGSSVPSVKLRQCVQKHGTDGRCATARIYHPPRHVCPENVSSPCDRDYSGSALLPLHSTSQWPLESCSSDPSFPRAKAPYYIGANWCVFKTHPSVSL